jgi:hypothetical protein
MSDMRPELTDKTVRFCGFSSFIMSLFFLLYRLSCGTVRLPSERDLFYFDTKQEYYAFYRWEYHGTFQDEFYFPSWYYLTDRADQMADLRAKQSKVSRDHLALIDPYSDKTLGDRCFYGAGQRFLTPIKLPSSPRDHIPTCHKSIETLISFDIRTSLDRRT